MFTNAHKMYMLRANINTLFKMIKMQYVCYGPVYIDLFDVHASYEYYV